MAASAILNFRNL